MYRFTGDALPFDVTTRNNLRFWTFAPDAILPGAGVPLLRDHDYAQRLGRVWFWPGRASGLTRTRVFVGQGLSVGVIPLDVEQRACGMYVRRAVLEEISIVSSPAYPECVITEVTEEDSLWPDTPALTS